MLPFFFTLIKFLPLKAVKWAPGTPCLRRIGALSIPAKIWPAGRGQQRDSDFHVLIEATFPHFTVNHSTTHSFSQILATRSCFDNGQISFCRIHTLSSFCHPTYTLDNPIMSDQVSEILEAPKEFVHDGMQFMKRCQKPDQKEFLKVSTIGVFLIWIHY